jgi:beta-galactosidase
MRIDRRSPHRVTIAVIISVIVLGATAAPVIAQRANDLRITSSFDFGWLFLKADAPGAEKKEFSDSGWRKLDVPHDWSIEGPADEKNSTGQGGGYMPSGVGWYRKHFTVLNEFRGRLVFIEFDGVMANSDVWINGVHLGNRDGPVVAAVLVYVIRPQVEELGRPEQFRHPAVRF